MNQGSSSPEAPGLNLPPPVADGEQLPASAAGETAPEAVGQAAPAAAERAPSSANSGATAAQPAIPLPTAADDSTSLRQTPQKTDALTTSSSKTKLITDEDLIEKEWVEKAKRIVENTRDDPRQQSEQLTMVKADYMKQRYGKTIKVSK